MDNGASSYRRYLDGEEEAFDRIIKDYYDHLVFFINSYVQSFATAEDLAVDVFSDLIVHRRRYNFKTPLKTYLFMLGRSRALNYIKRSKIVPTVELSAAEHLGTPSVEELYFADLRKQALYRALDQLEEQQRTAIHLVYLEDLSCADAAVIMKKNTKQVYNLLYRAKERLRTILGMEEWNDE